jgi:hypothetical protein
MTIRSWSGLVKAVQEAKELEAKGDRRGAANLILSVTFRLKVVEEDPGSYSLETTTPRGHVFRLRRKLDEAAAEDHRRMIKELREYALGILNAGAEDFENEFAQSDRIVEYRKSPALRVIWKY